MKVAIETLGCKTNQYESDAMMKLFEEKGYEITDSLADIYVINTCTVTNLSARKSRQFISRAKKENPASLLAVVGCYPQTEPDLIEDLGVDVIIGTQGRSRIVDLCEEALETKKQVSLIKSYDKNTGFEELKVDENYEMTRAYLKIQEGCNQFCSYCIIPYARGPIRSRDMENILEEAEILARTGYKELVITGIHLASYGLELKERDLSLIDVVEKLSAIKGIERIRLSSLEPRIVDGEFLQRLKEVDEFCPSFHLSLQSGSDKILKAMNRKYDREMYLEKINLINKYFPNAGLTTDIMVGFPGENDEDFEDTLDMVRKVNFSSVHVFRYSKRKGTKAAEYKNQVNGNVKKERSQILRDLADESERKFLDEQIGMTHEVLFETKVDKYNIGHSKNYVKIHLKSPENLEGQIKSVIITKRKDNLLIAELV